MDARPSPRPPEEQDVILVAVRCRPLSESESTEGNESIARILDGKLVIILDPGCASDDYLRLNKSRERRYCFDHAFGPESNTTQVFERTAKVIVPGVLSGFNATVFAYGATGAGKTHTMIGKENHPGIMMQTLNELFDQVEARKEDTHFSITCSFVEVYNEQIKDLLKPENKEMLELREDPFKGVCINGIHEVGGIQSSDEIMKLLQRGNGNRSTEPTYANVTSSRSHAVLQVCIEHHALTTPSGGVGESFIGKLSLIDLAGSERASANDNKGIRLLEGANINRSLLALGNCINALAEPQRRNFVPYRNSKLTRFLKDSLGGNCRTVMIANISPSNANYEDTHNTLKYASRAKNIKVGAYKNPVHVDEHLTQYAHIIDELRQEVGSLKLELQHKHTKVNEKEPSLASLEAVGEQWKHKVITNMEKRTHLQHELIEVEALIAQPLKDKEDAYLKRKARIEQDLVKNRQDFAALQSSLPRQVVNQDLRAFLDLVLRTCVLEVERMELDHIQSSRQQLLDSKDQDLQNLRWQLHLRNEYIAEQRVLLTTEQKQQLPGHVSLLESTITSPRQWISKERCDREGSKESAFSIESIGIKKSGEGNSPKEGGNEPFRATYWKGLEVPKATKIKGLARIVEPINLDNQRPRADHIGWAAPPQPPRPEYKQPTSARDKAACMFEEEEQSARSWHARQGVDRTQSLTRVKVVGQRKKEDRWNERTTGRRRTWNAMPGEVPRQVGQAKRKQQPVWRPKYPGEQNKCDIKGEIS